MPRQAMDFASMGSNLGRAIMSAGGAKDAAYLDTTKKMADIDMLQGRGEYFRSQAEESKLKAEEARRFADSQKPENITRIATSLAGLTEDKAPAVHDYFTNGNFGITPGYSLPVDQAGPTTPDTPNPAPGWATPEALTRIGQYRGALSTQGGLTGKTDFNNLIGGMKAIWEQQQLDDAKSGKFTPEMAKGMNALEAAKKGSLYGVHEFGTFNNATGNLDFNQPYLDKNASTIAQDRAQAASAYSTANLNRARIPEVQSQIDLNKSKTGQVQTITMPDGTEVVTGPAIPKLTEIQAKSQLFGSRAAEADRIMRELEGKYSPLAVNSKLGAEGVWGVGGLLGAVGNKMLPAEAQKAEQSQRDFINAVLRQESGAAIAPSEFDNARKQYFQQPGDSKEVLSQKESNRKMAIEGLKVMAGPASSRVNYGGNPQPKAPAQDKTQALSDAKAAIAAGAPRAAVIQRLKEMGINEGAI